MYDQQSINLHEILTYWGFSDAKLIKHFHLDSPRIVAKIENENRHYILKGIHMLPLLCSTKRLNKCRAGALGDQPG